MDRGWRGWIHSLSVRLLGWLLLVIVAVFSIYSVVSFGATSARWTESAYSWGENTSELIERATHYAMLLNRKEDVQQTVMQLVRDTGIGAVRVYDKQGVVVFSNDAEEIGSRVDLQAEMCVACHNETTGAFRQDHAVSNLTRVFRSHDGSRVLGIIRPIENQKSCSEASCHAHSRGQTVLGVLDVQVSLQPLDDALGDTRRQLLWLTIGMAIIVIIGTVLSVRYLVRRPVHALYEGTVRISRGDLDTIIDVHTRDELGRLAVAFNNMTTDLRRARNDSERWSLQLEQKVIDKTAELGRMQRQAMHMEKMASLGRLAATVAHELNNPLAGILTYAKLVQRELGDQPVPPEVQEELNRYLGFISSESTRCGNIVRNLLLFARQSEARLGPVRLRDLIDRSLMLVRHHLEMRGLKLETAIDAADDSFTADGDQIQQAVIALLMNAIEAMSGIKDGVLSVRTEMDAENAVVFIGDSGVGIAPEILPHIFEPFFSTKDKESGVGLGLSVVYGVVSRHGGRVDVDSQVGRGSTFKVTLPRRPPVSSAKSSNGVRHAS